MSKSTTTLEEAPYQECVVEVFCRHVSFAAGIRNVTFPTDWENLEPGEL